MAGLGDTWMLPKPGQETEHLWVLITKPDPATFMAVMVNVTSQRQHSDTTTILNVGDHAFIKKPSVVLYADARMVDARLLDAAVTSGAYHSHAPFSGAVLQRIQAGVLASPLTPNKIKAYFRAEINAGRTS